MSRRGSGDGLTPPRPRWAAPPAPDTARVGALMEALSLPEPICSVLAVRGYDEVDAAKRFLRPRLDHLHDPAALADAPRAAERIAAAVRSGERIFVHGDYDVDGICGTALLTRALRRLGGSVDPFVPHRLRDGYDFTAAGLAAARAAGAGLIVTVDCGTVAHETVEAATAAGLDVIVTDHHTVGATLPPAFAVVNPKRADCDYPEEDLCGAGLAWKLAGLVADALGGDASSVESELELVALATVADLVPLRGENRVLVQHGLRRLQAPSPGLAALMRAAEVEPTDVGAGTLGYQIGPRINAAGRIGDATDGLRLLLAGDEAEARPLAERLDALNRERRDEDARTLDQALEQLVADFDPDRDHGVVIAGQGWHPGVIGIVASRVVERIHRPVVMLAVDGETARGSARSIPGFHLYEALAACSGLLRRFGGHRQAAGLDIEVGRIPEFREAFNAAARERLSPELLRPELRPDADLDLSDADERLAHWLGYLGPHGIGNPGPLFRARGLEVASAREVGSGHLKSVLRNGRGSLEAIGFGMLERFPLDGFGRGPWDALFRLERNEWRGRVSAQAKLVDLRPSEG